jgi:hypothetical protein
MNDVRDEALGAKLEQEANRIESVPVDRLPDVLRRGGRLRAIRFTAIGAALAVFAGAVSWTGLTLPNAEDVIPADIAEWRTYASLESDRWTLQVPPPWRIQALGPCRLSTIQRGAVVTNVDFAFRNRDGALAGCGEPFVWAGFPRDGVALAVQPFEHFGLAVGGPITPFPLTPDLMDQSGAVRGGPPESYVGIRIPGEDYPVAIVSRWVGPDASAADVDALDRMLASLEVRSSDRWTETDGGLTTLHDEKDNYVVTYPSEWIVADENLTPWLGSPWEILSLGTFTLRVSENPEDGLRIWDAPVTPAALADMSSDDALVSVQEAGLGGFGDRHRRPVTFGPLGCEDAIYGCHPSEDPDLPDAARNVPFRAWWIPFQDAGRGFYLFVAIGNDASPELREQAWAVADSLAFDPGAG